MTHATDGKRYGRSYEAIPSRQFTEARPVLVPKRNAIPHVSSPLPALRFEISEASQILRMSRAQIYNRTSDGAIKAQKDGARTYITLVELERYVESCS